MEEKILFVDDEANALAGYERNLHRDFLVTTATGGVQALEAMDANGPFAVVISDMRMPGMNGAEFLAQVRSKSPDTIRMLLTGHSDLNAAISAVNDGKIFRYLTKPCEKSVLVEAVTSCIEQYRMRNSERELIKRGRLADRVREEPDAAGEKKDDDPKCAGPLPDRYQALRHLTSVCGADQKSFVVLFHLPQFAAIEQRYGPDTAKEYMHREALYLVETLSPQDWIYHWRSDALLAIIRWPLELPKVVEALALFTSKRREHSLNVDGQQIRIVGKMTFDLLPAIEYAEVDDILEAFADREIGLS